MNAHADDAYSVDLVRLMELGAQFIGLRWPDEAPDRNMQPGQPLARVSAAVVDALWDRVADDRVVPLCRAMVQLASVFDFGGLPAAIVSCSTQKAALETLPRYLPLLCTLIEVDMVVDEHVVLVRLRKNPELHWCTELFFLTFLVRLNSLLLRLRTTVSGVLVAHPIPTVTEEALQQHFDSVVIGQAACTGVIVDPTTLIQSRPCYSPLVHDAQTALADAALSELESPLGLRIRDVVRELIIAQKDVTVPRVAARVHMSTRTMQRKLRKEGRSLSDYVALVRKDMAKNALIATQDGIGVIARDLGFRTTSSFTKFFTHQVGTSPREYRRAQTL